MKHWLLKSEPDVWSLEQQRKAGKKGNSRRRRGKQMMTFQQLKRG